VRIVPYEPWHYEYLAGKTFTTLKIGSEAIRLFSLAYDLRGVAVTIQDGNQVIGCAGIMELWPGVGEAWSMFTDEIRGHPFYLHSRTKKIMADMISSRNYHRVQATVLSTDPVAIKWIERLGFQKECNMKQFGSDKSDHFLYVRMR
jgi:hypothetical protein